MPKPRSGTKPPPNRWMHAELEVMLECLGSDEFMRTHAPSFPAGIFPVMTVREASTKSSEQHMLCQAIAKEILSRAGQHNNNNARPFASLAAKFAAARAENPGIAPEEAFKAFDLDAFMQRSSSGARGAEASSKPNSLDAAGAADEDDGEDEDERQDDEPRKDAQEEATEQQQEEQEAPKAPEPGGSGTSEYDD
eukprot:3105030-Prymnesium_polylepis.1